MVWMNFYRLPGRGRPQTASKVENVNDDVAYFVLSQEDHPQTHRTVRQIARKASIRRSCVCEIIQKTLKLI